MQDLPSHDRPSNAGAPPAPEGPSLRGLGCGWVSSAFLFLLVPALAVLFFPAWLSWYDARRCRRQKSCLLAMKASLEAYQKHFGDYPESPRNKALVNALTSPGPASARWYEFSTEEVSKSGEVVDCWGHPLVYGSGRIFKAAGPSPSGPETRHFWLYSVGPNGKDDLGDDDDILVTD